MAALLDVPFPAKLPLAGSPSEGEAALEVKFPLAESPPVGEAETLPDGPLVAGAAADSAGSKEEAGKQKQRDLHGKIP